MQDIHSIGGGRLLAGGAGGDRRLRPHHHQNQQGALKCPRCDSLNTKFCYYNNYNLSQPRHFCKSCRRYWTKGGVLRNVPVGGGCRKTKRSKPKASSATSAAAATTTVNTTTPPPAPSQDRKSNSNSSSESSSLTAATNTTATATATEAVSALSTTPASNLMKINQGSKFFAAQSSSNPSFEAPPSAPPSLLEQGGSNCGIFSEIGSLTSLIASSATGAMPNFEYGSISDVSISPFRLNQNHHQQQQHNQHPVQQSQSWHEQGQKVTMSVADDQELKSPEITGGLLDRTVQVDLSVLHDGRSNGGGFESLGDWQHCGDQGLFDLPYTVDQAYWSQSHWTDQDHPSLYLP